MLYIIIIIATEFSDFRYYSAPKCIILSESAKKQQQPLMKFTVKHLNKDTFGTSCFVLYREVVLFQR